MAISILGSTQSSQVNALAVTQAVEASATSQTSNQAASSVVNAASGIRVSGRTSQSLSDIIQASHVNLGYSKEETKSFTTMIDAAQDYLNNIKQWASDEAAAAASTDPDKLAVDAEPTEQQKQQQQVVDTYGKDFIANMEKGLDQVMSAFLDHTLVFKTFSVGVTGDVNIMAKTFKTDADGKIRTDLDFSFFQSQTLDEKTSQPKVPAEYGATWSVNDMRLFSRSPDRVL